jgi:hypothetical protein
MDAHRDGVLRGLAWQSGASASPGAKAEVRYQAYPEGSAPFLKQAAEASAVAVDDVRQGELDDCYWMASVAALANHPKGPSKIESMIRPGASPSEYEVTFANGDKQVVDTRYLALNGALFGRGTDVRMASMMDRGPAELWPAILEAGFALRKGKPLDDARTTTMIADRYDALNFGQSKNAMVSLVGDSHKVNAFEKFPDSGGTNRLFTPEAAENAIRAAAKDPNVIVVVETGTDAASASLRADHAYTFLGVDDHGNIHLRDPIGGMEHTMPIREATNVLKTVTVATLT